MVAEAPIGVARHGGRAACVQCKYCVGFACPTDAKNGSQNTMIPRANNARPRRLYSTFVEDGSFLRLQTITLAYQLPPRLLRGARTARLYLTAQNVLVLDSYSGFDPEVNSIGGDSRYRGVDAGAYPRARVVNVGISVGL